MAQTRKANIARMALEPAQAITCKASGALTGRTFVKVKTGGVANKPLVEVAGAGEQAFGVVEYDAASGADVSVIRAGAIEVKFTAAAVAGGVHIEVGTTGFGRAVASGVRIGTLLADVGSGGVGFVMLSNV